MSSIITSNKSLTILNFSDNDITMPGAMRICEAIKINQTMQVCYLGVDCLGADGLSQILEGGAEANYFWDTRIVII